MNQSFHYEWVFQPRFHNSSFCWWKLYNLSDVESTFLQRIKFSSRILFFLKKKCCKTRFRNFFFAKFHRKNFKDGSLRLAYREIIWAKISISKQFLNQKIDTSVFINQLFHNSSVFEWKIFTTYQMLNQHFFNASSFQVELCFFIKSKFVAKLALEFFFAELHRKNFKEGSWRLP